MRRRFARRTAGSAGRSGGGADEWKNIPILGSRVRSCGTLQACASPSDSSPACASAPASRGSSSRTSATVDDVWPRLGLGDEPPGLLYAVNRVVRRARARARGRRRGGADPARQRAARAGFSPTPLDLAAAVAEVETDEAGAIATFVGTVRRRSRGRDVQFLDYEAFEEMAEPMLDRLARRADRAARALRRRDPPPDRPRRDRRAERRDRRLRRAPRRRPRSVPRGDRHAEGDDPALEERGVRGRRGMDREGIVNQ